MSPDLSTAAWTLPSCRQFMRKIGLDLRDGVSLVIFFPPSADMQAFKRSLLDYIDRELYLKTDFKDLSCFDGIPPFDFLCQIFPGLMKSQYLEKAVDSPDLPDVILLEGLSQCANTTVQNWINTIARWAEACRSSGARHSLVFFLTLEDFSFIKLPPTDVRLKYRILAGFPSALEVRLLCRMETNEIDAENQWREYILSSLAGNDLFLCEHLWEEVFNPAESINDALIQYATKNGWNKNTTNTHFHNWRPKPPGVDLTFSPNEKTFSLLSSGISIYTPEYGEEIHPGFLALNGGEKEISHRIWRAQAALILPMIDDLRRRICEYFTSKYGNNWAILGNEILIPPLEMGELKTYFETLPSNSYERRQWGFGIHQAWWIRNELAHYKPISFRVFCELWRLSGSVHSLINQNIK